MKITNKNIFKGGNATFTVHNNKGEHYTFKIVGGESKPLFVQLLSGPNNENDYSYMGVFNPHENIIKLTQKSKYGAESKPVKVFNWAVKAVASNNIPSGYGVLHDGSCCRCGRKLTTPESITLGIGPECIKKAQW